MSTSPKPSDSPGRPECLGDAARRKIVALVAAGCSRRVAARIAGCNHSTITNTALRDPDFAAELAAADHCLEMEAICRVRDAASEKRYWRAAAWIAERKNPRDFAPRPPGALKDQEVAEILGILLQPWMKRLSDDDLECFCDQLDVLTNYFRNHPDARDRLRMSLPMAHASPLSAGLSSPFQTDVDEILRGAFQPQPFFRQPFTPTRHPHSEPDK